MKKVEIVTEEAWAAFAAWIKEHDAEGEMDVLDQATAYGKWCDDQKRMANLPPDLQ